VAGAARKARLSVPSASLPRLVDLFQSDRPAPAACDAGNQVARECACKRTQAGGGFLPEPTQRDEASRGLSPDPKDRDHQTDGRFGQEAAATRRQR
jgi:hypothetical protein